MIPMTNEHEFGGKDYVDLKKFSIRLPSSNEMTTDELRQYVYDLQWELDSSKRELAKR